MSNQNNIVNERLTIEATTCKTGGEHTIGRGIISHDGHSHPGGPQKCLMCDKTLEQLFKESNKALLDRLEAEGQKDKPWNNPLRQSYRLGGTDDRSYRLGYNAAITDQAAAIKRIREGLG